MIRNLHIVLSPDQNNPKLSEKRPVSGHVIKWNLNKTNCLKIVKEERLRFVNIETKKAKTVQRRYLNDLMETRSVEIESNQRIIRRPARLLPLQLL